MKLPKSKKRKKDGKKVQGHGAQIVVDPDAESSVTMQDLINVLAYQEYVKDGKIVEGDVVIESGDNAPVRIINIKENDE